MKKKIFKIAVIGANGRMGQELLSVLEKDRESVAFVGVVREGVAKGFLHSSKNLSSPHLKEADVWIDFSTVENLEQVLAAAKKMRKPVVSGVTGFTKRQQELLRRTAQSIPLLWSSNMSFGVAALKKVLGVVRELEDFDFQIEEIHHRHKKDRPSGTALDLQQTLQKQRSEKIPMPLSIRGGAVIGVHKVWMMSDSEVLCFEHQAVNRSVFAKGAMRAAKWIRSKRKGLYSMEDLFNEK